MAGEYEYVELQIYRRGKVTVPALMIAHDLHRFPRRDRTALSRLMAFAADAVAIEIADDLLEISRILRLRFVAFLAGFLLIVLVFIADLLPFLGAFQWSPAILLFYVSWISLLCVVCVAWKSLLCDLDFVARLPRDLSVLLALPVGTHAAGIGTILFLGPGVFG